MRRGTASTDRRLAGEAVIFRGEPGNYFAIPIDVLAACAREPAVGLERDSTTPRFAVESARLGLLQFLGVNDDAIVFRDRLGACVAVPRSVFSAARVPPDSAADLEAQLPRVGRPARVHVDPFGPLHLLGSFELTYVPGAQDSTTPAASRGADTHHRPTASAHREFADARQAFFRSGWCTLSGGAFHRQLGRLAEEATTLVRAASHEYEIASEDKLAIRMKRYATTGPVLESVHHDAAVLSALRALSGALVVPTQAAYYFYDGDGYISVHTDASHCPLAVLTSVFGDPPPLMAYPRFRGCSPEALSTLAEGAGDRSDAGEPMRFPADGAIVFEGCDLPHYRPRGGHGRDFVGVAQLCYRSVWTRIRPPRTMVGAHPLTPAAER
jgi:hypothetical protein